MIKLSKFTLLAGLLMTGVLFVGVVQAQSEFSNKQDKYGGYDGTRVERRVLIDAITAGMLPRASFDFDIRTFTNGGVQSAVSVGLLDRLTIGLSYGAATLLTEDKPDWNPNMEFLVKYRILTEKYVHPSIAFGYCSQGSGPWDEENERYAQKSKGFFFAVTKSYLVYRNQFAFTGGINITPEGWEKEKDPSVYLGAVTQLNDDVFILGEYDLALNDNERYAQYGMGRGFLNIGLEWVLNESVSLEFDLRNLLKNRDVTSFDRGVRLLYLEHF